MQSVEALSSPGRSLWGRPPRRSGRGLAPEARRHRDSQAHSGVLGVAVTCHSHLHTCPGLRVAVTPFISSSLPGAPTGGVGLEGEGKQHHHELQQHDAITGLRAPVEGKPLCIGGVGAAGARSMCWPGQGKTGTPKAGG